LARWGYISRLRTLRSQGHFALAGASVPLTGFGNALAKGVREAVAESGLLGAFTGGLTACAGGICAAVFFALITALVFRAKDKNK